MLPRSKPVLALFFVLPLVLAVWMWALAQRRPRLVATLVSSATSLAFSHEGKSLAIGSSDGKLALWNSALKSTQTVSIEGKPLRSSETSLMELHFSSDDATLLASNVPLISHNAVYSWNAQNRRVEWSVISDAKNDQSQYYVSPDGMVAVQLAYDIVKVLDISRGGTPQSNKTSKVARSFPVLSRFKSRFKTANGANAFPQTLALSPDKKTVAVVSLAHELQFWDVASGQKQSQTPPLSAAKYSGSTQGEWQLQYSPDGRYVALFDGLAFWLWDTQKNQWTAASQAGVGSEPSLVWAPDSRSLWTGSSSAQQWSVPSLQLLRELPVSGPIAISGDGHILATRNNSADGTNGVWLWNIE